MTSYSFNTAEELNKIYWDESTRTFLYREDGFVCCIAQSLHEFGRVHPRGNQNIYKYIEQHSEGLSYSYRDRVRSKYLTPLLTMDGIMKRSYLFNPMNESMVQEKDEWIQRILSAKKRIQSRKNKKTAV